MVSFNKIIPLRTPRMAARVMPMSQHLEGVTAKPSEYRWPLEGRELSRTYTCLSLNLPTPSHQRIAPQQNSTHVKLARHPWVRCVRLSGSCKQCSSWRVRHPSGDLQDVPWDSLGPWLHRVISKLWSNETAPSNWSEATLLPLFKEGNKRICSSYIRISSKDVAAKFFGVTLLKRFRSERDQSAHPNQSDFAPGWGCTDQLHYLRRTLEQRWSFQQVNVLRFVDFAPAFDSVDRGE